MRVVVGLMRTGTGTPNRSRASPQRLRTPSRTRFPTPIPILPSTPTRMRIRTRTRATRWRGCRLRTGARSRRRRRARLRPLLALTLRMRWVGTIETRPRPHRPSAGGAHPAPAPAPAPARAERPPRLCGATANLATPRARSRTQTRNGHTCPRRPRGLRASGARWGARGRLRGPRSARFRCMARRRSGLPPRLAGAGVRVGARSGGSRRCSWRRGCLALAWACGGGV
ncbi:hypothetical protein C8F04DRAFT_1069834 [Mycena alexandri]|uniref:Uncharacterized protein n=1 Tax=Mycena alexandri TaxID=1745969 RepID=A0AAD6XED4_9AGAR|nr:hypothetical protein C8F04DRAFT_1069834 [Mycena alexandri]